jgi:hypothetical protein
MRYGGRCGKIHNQSRKVLAPKGNDGTDPDDGRLLHIGWDKIGELPVQMNREGNISITLHAPISKNRRRRATGSKRENGASIVVTISRAS